MKTCIKKCCSTLKFGASLLPFLLRRKNMKRNERPTSAMEADSGNSNVRGFAHIPLSKALE
jgi:hypothetical protein